MRDWKLWTKAAGMRAVKTAAQAAVALIPAGVTIAFVDWKVIQWRACRSLTKGAE